MYRILSIAITIVLLPVIIPLAIYIGLCYHWEDTVPKPEED